ncbi:MAG TPA: protein kinase [Terriglobales bacterium]|nr:protein kinase [Terriglobales bacterium]
MPLVPGTKLGPYEIQSAVGAGGMGEVYKARDTRLERIVAIKVLPSHLSSNSELRARFEREAKAISGLQHPHICVLYDVGSQNGIDFLVMEYLEGETLYTRIARKPLSTDETIKIAIEIADALEKAHRSGIIHRDLKPGNVMLTKSGAKLMDFGLAKPNALAGGPSSGAPGISSMATMAATMADLASPVTVAGTLIGTVQYMSPEQIQGKEADARSDIFAFGATLYEMLTGKRAFQGKSQLSLASAILEKDPEPIAAVVPLTPPALDQIVRTCLAKEPDDRFQSAHDLKLQLQWISAGGSQAGTPAIVSTKRKKTTTALTAALIAGWLLAALAGVLVLLYANRLTTAQQPLHTSIEPPAGFDFFSVADGAPAISPDGQQVAFLAAKKGIPMTPGGGSLYLLQLSTGESTPVPGAQSALFPFWSPDGKYLGFFSEGKLEKIPVAGGTLGATVQVLCDAPEGRGGSWNEQGTIIFAPRIAGPLQSVSDGGGIPVEITKADSSGQGYTDRDPYFLPDGKHFLFVRRAKDSGSVYAGSLDSSGTRHDGDIKQILPNGSNVAYSDGYLFYVKEGTLTAQAFDPSSLTFKGKPVSIASNIEFAPARNEGSFSVSRNVLLYRATSVVNRELAWFDLSGKELDHWGEPAPYVGGKFFPATQTALLLRFTPAGNSYSVWISDVARKTVNRLTQDSDRSATGVVSPDGKDVWISTTTGYISNLTRKSLSASGAEEKVLENINNNLILFDISRDGRYLVFNHQDPKTDFDIYAMDLQDNKKLFPVLNGPSAERNGRVSPDGKWLAYVSNETGADELFVTSFPVPGTRWQVSSGGATSPADWSADGKTLRYRKGEKIFNVEVHSGASKPDFSAPKELLSLPTNILDVSLFPDGKRILALRPSGDTAPIPVDFVLNWQHLVK